MLVTHILNHGKKPLAYQISYRAVKKIRQNVETNQLFVLCQAIHGATFNIAVKVGGSTRHVPMKMPHILLEEKFISIIQSCKSTKHLEQIQTQIVTHGLQHNEFVVPRFLSACAESKRMGIARKVFDYIPEPNIAHWNTLFKGYIKNELYKEVVVLFSHMNKMDLKPNCFIFPMVLKSCGKLPALRKGEEVHCVAIKVGFKSNSFVGTTLIDMYSVVGQTECAYRVFSEMAVKNVVAWTTMINGYILAGDLISARHLFEFSPERDVILWNTMVSGYIELGDMLEARKLFGLMPCRDLMSWNTLLNGYANNGDVEKCERLFEEMPEKNIFSWNGLLGGYAQNGHFTKVLSAFKRMLNESDVHPNDVTLVNVLSACARLGTLDLGKWVHVYAENKRYKNNVYVGNGLIDMYAKCGEIKSAILVFRNMDKKDLISWNTIINGLAIHGHGADALSMFHEMTYVGEQPDGITFTGILCSCSHLGLVGDGLEYFHSMINEYSIIPQIQHYGCVVDMLARAGLLYEAVDFVKKMPVKADGVIWTSLVGACRVYRNTKLAELALEQLIELEPENPSNYVMLSNIYGEARRWGDLARLKVTMRDTGSRKLPGCSLIEVDDGVVEFYSFDERHPKRDDIYGTLRGLTRLLRLSGYVPDLLELGQVF